MREDRAGAAPSQLPASGGTYVLVCEARGSAHIQVGRLGALEVRSGWYAYVGSALGPGGLRARLRRHWRLDKSPRWHFDYLRPHLDIRCIWYVESCKHCETAWAATLGRLAGATVPLRGFGASDYSGASHLYGFARQPRLLDFVSELDVGDEPCAVVREWSPPAA